MQEYRLEGEGAPKACRGRRRASQGLGQEQQRRGQGRFQALRRLAEHLEAELAGQLEALQEEGC